MKITVEHLVSDMDATVSAVFVDERFVCFGLEDEYRLQKVAKETRIPAGTYNVALRTAGSMHPRYQAKFPDLHRGMLHVLEVPNFEWIYIHIGNTDEHTEGCLLVGNGAQSAEDDKSVQNSTDAYKRLYGLVCKAAQAGELEIEYIDRDLNVTDDAMV